MTRESPDIVYIYASASNTNKSSVQQKIISQILESRKLGISMEGWFFTTDPPIYESEDMIRWFYVKPIKKGYFRSIRQSRKIHIAILQNVKKEQINKTKFFMRFGTQGFSLLRIVFCLRRNLVFNHVCKEPMEISLYKTSSTTLLSKFLSNLEHKWYHLITQYTIGRISRFFVGRAIVNSHEIGIYQRIMAFGRYSFAVVPDGVSSSAYAAYCPPEINDEIHLIFLKGASFDAPYYGLDRLFSALQHQTSTKRFYLTIIGANLEFEKNLALEYNVREFVNFKNEMNKSALDKEFNHYHMAVGTLGSHRKGLLSNSTIKNREYFARGIPFFFAHHDPDISDNEVAKLYSLELAADDSMVNLESLEKFVQKVREINNWQMGMREYAAEKMDFSVKVREIADFILS
jgi:hypothetical protein